MFPFQKNKEKNADKNNKPKEETKDDPMDWYATTTTTIATQT